MGTTKDKEAAFKEDYEAYKEAYEVYKVACKVAEEVYKVACKVAEEVTFKEVYDEAYEASLEEFKEASCRVSGKKADEAYEVYKGACKVAEEVYEVLCKLPYNRRCI